MVACALRIDWLAGVDGLMENVPQRTRMFLGRTGSTEAAACSASSLFDASVVLRVGSANQNCNEVCALVGENYYCDRDATSSINSEEMFNQVNPLVGWECPEGVQRNWAPAGSDAFISYCTTMNPFYDQGPPQCFFCSDTTLTRCDTKHIYRKRLCACNLADV